jgi:hypothetical protein
MTILQLRWTARKTSLASASAPEKEEESEPFVPLYTLKAQETQELIKNFNAILRISEPYEFLRENANNLHDRRDLAFVVAITRAAISWP